MKKWLQLLLVSLFLINFASAQLSINLENGELLAPEDTNLNGFVALDFSNQEEEAFEFVFSRLKEGSKVEAFVTASREVAASFAEDSTSDPRPAMSAYLEIADVYGGLLVASGETGTAYIKLEPGIYVFEAYPNEGGDAYFYSVLTVNKGETVVEPEADLNLTMVDHHFSFPVSIKAGQQRWQISNMGEQVHFAILFKLAKWATADDLMAGLEANFENGPPPIDMETPYTNFIEAVGPGQTYYADVNLPAGNYVAICFMPDMESEKMHLELGMMSMFAAE